MGVEAVPQLAQGRLGQPYLKVADARGLDPGRGELVLLGLEAFDVADQDLDLPAAPATAEAISTGRRPSTSASPPVGSSSAAVVSP